jgi:DNA modification methylase
VGRDKAYPSNVLHLATETDNRSHSAAFPRALPEWFIKLFTKEGDWVLDPFVGSGTTCEVAQQLGRNSMGIDIKPEYVELAKEKTDMHDLMLFEKTKKYGSVAKK